MGFGTYDFFRPYGGQLCVYCLDGKHNSRGRDPNEVWNTVTEDGHVNIVGNSQGIELVHFLPRISKCIEETIHLVLEDLLHRGEGVPVT